MGIRIPHSGAYGYAIANQVFGSLQSDLITVSPSTQNDPYAYVRDELDPDDSASAYALRVKFYDANEVYLGTYQNSYTESVR